MISQVRESRSLDRVLGHMLASAAVPAHVLSVRGAAGEVSKRHRVHPFHGGMSALAAKAKELADEIDPAGILIYLDLLHTRYVLAACADWPRRPPLAVYLPLEGELTAPLSSVFGWVDQCVGFTRFAVEQLRSRWPATAPDGSSVRTRFHCIGHGVDRSQFFPLADLRDEQAMDDARVRARRALFAGRPELWDAFLVLNGNSPYPRKRLDLTLDAFARFARGKPANVRLVLHQPLEEASARPLRAAIEAMIRQRHLDDRVVFSLPANGPGHLSVDALNLLYNACAVGLTTSMGEGWGLVSFEHAATGAAQVVPAHTSFAENWEGAAELVRIARRIRCPHPRFDMQAPSVTATATALERLYLDPEHRLRMARAAHARSLAQGWAPIREQWKQLFEELDP